MNNTFKGILCLLVLVIIFAFITPDVSKANTTNHFSNYLDDISGISFNSQRESM